jgi:prophage DNA circulation protein
VSYRDRLQELIYTSPSGKSFALRFVETNRERGKKAPVNEFPNQNQGSVQDLGQTTPRYPVNCYIDGPDYDIEADRLWQALNESGPGELQHPRYGVIPVLPTSIRQAEQFIDGTGRATFDIDFVQADEIALEYPRTAALASASVSAAADEAVESVGDSVGDVEIEDPGAKAGLQDSVTGALSATVSAFDKITNISTEVRTKISSAVDGITSNLTALVNAPVDLALELAALYRIPADTVDDVKAKVDGYATLIDALIASATETTSRYGAEFGLVNAANINAACIAAAEASATGTSRTRASGIDAALALRDIADKQAQAMEAIGADEYDSYRATRRALTLALDALIRNSVALPTERVHITEADVTVLELVYQLYGVDGDIEALMDRIIDYNLLIGTQIIIIPAGTEIRWYA